MGSPNVFLKSYCLGWQSTHVGVWVTHVGVNPGELQGSGARKRQESRHGTRDSQCCSSSGRAQRSASSHRPPPGKNHQKPWCSEQTASLQPRMEHLGLREPSGAGAAADMPFVQQERCRGCFWPGGEQAAAGWAGGQRGMRPCQMCVPNSWQRGPACTPGRCHCTSQAWP